MQQLSKGKIFMRLNLRKKIFYSLFVCFFMLFLVACGISRASWESQTDFYENDKAGFRKTPERPADILIQP